MRSVRWESRSAIVHSLRLLRTLLGRPMLQRLVSARCLIETYRQGSFVEIAGRRSAAWESAYKQKGSKRADPFVSPSFPITHRSIAISVTKYLIFNCIMNVAWPSFHFESMTSLDIFVSIEGKQYSPSKPASHRHQRSRTRTSIDSYRSEPPDWIDCVQLNPRRLRPSHESSGPLHQACCRLEYDCYLVEAQQLGRCSRTDSVVRVEWNCDECQGNIELTRLGTMIFSMLLSGFMTNSGPTCFYFERKQKS